MAQRRRTSLIETGLPPRGSPHSRPPPTIVVDDVAASRSPLHWDWSAVETGSRPASPGRPASPRRVTALDDHIGPSVTGDGRRAAAAALALSTPELRNPTDRGRESAARVGSPVTRRLAQEDGAEMERAHSAIDLSPSDPHRPSTVFVCHLRRRSVDASIAQTSADDDGDDRGPSGPLLAVPGAAQRWRHSDSDVRQAAGGGGGRRESRARSLSPRPPGTWESVGALTYGGGDGDGGDRSLPGRSRTFQTALGDAYRES